ncbi:thiol-disulfide oxidoreductase LTO1-like isoform X2 [Salvia miltiorrhiza]|uniref:thiol-disulfide oxidoreductase LTO1-like isoform X2 n=1 Tax=Salvia miltiorrhiza TaxID=226208 RepID=UPI0025AD8504|nr:thiol-disulfide oxidoreductase LTO1-like isoform X2 [Salvia miltiorrhiza]
MSSTSFLTKSPASLPRRRNLLLTSPLRPQFPASLFKKGVCKQRLLMLKVNCGLEGSELTAKSDSSAVVDENDGVFSAYGWCAALGGLGFLETAYLTLVKLANSEALCPIAIGEGSCDAILNSDFASILGVPLPLYGMVAYGLVAILGLGQQLGFQKMPFDVKKTDADTILVGITTSMVVGSTYFLYILSTEFGGESCLYCLTSSALAFSLFLITIKNFGIDRIKEMLGSRLCIASLVIIALAASYNVVQPVSSSLAATELPYVEKEITNESSPLAISLARHLRSTGARLYGAFWCSHCVHQKEIFGREAAKLLDYIECYPDGVRAGTKMAEACYGVNLKYFPSWEINGQVLSGEKQFEELATLSGIKLEDLSH